MESESLESVSRQTFARLRRVVTVDRVATVITGLLIFSVSMQRFFLERMTLLERAGIGLALLFCLVIFSNRRMERISLSVPLIMLILVMGLSLFQFPDVRFILDFCGYVILALFAVIVVGVFGTKVVIDGVVTALILLTAQSAFIALDKVLASQPVGRFTGDFYGPNTLAASLIVLTPAIFAFQRIGRSSTIVARICLLISTGGIIVISQATTELFTFASIVVAWAFFRFVLNASNRIRKVFIAAFAATVMGLVILWPILLHIRGKQTNLSGRTELWAAYLNKIWERPFTGHGWAIQTRLDMPLGEYINRVMGVPLANAHDDFLNWWAHTGIFGLICYLAILVGMVIVAIRLRKRNRSVPMWAFISAVAFVVNGFAELTAYYPDGWMVLCLVSSSLAFKLATAGYETNLGFSWGLASLPLRTDRRKTATGLQ